MRATLIIPALALTGLSALQAQEAAPAKTPFDAQPFLLTPETPPEFPLAEKGLGEPLPINQEAMAQAAEADTAAQVLEEENARVARIRDLFNAVVDGDETKAAALLASGVPVDSQLPLPAPAEFVARFRDSHLHYFVTIERGLTPLMLAAGLGQPKMVKLLLESGASLNARTKRHRTFPLWLAGKGRHVAVMQMLLGVQPESETARSLIEVDLATQTAQLFRDGTIAASVPISSGRKSFPTKPGDYVVTDKHTRWRSTLYPADMPFFMRLSCGDIGFHAGNLPGYPASHGCIRLNYKDAKALFDLVPVGTRVVIK